MKKLLFLLLFLMTFILNVNAENSNKSFVQKVVEGQYSNYSTIDKFGVNYDVDIATVPEPIWEFGGTYEFSLTDDIVSISSSDNTDTHEIMIYGLDADGYILNQTVELQGQTRVTIENLWRVYRIQNNDIRDLEGHVYVYSGTEETDGVPSGDSVAKAMIDNGNNQTLMAIYTVPKGYVGYLYRGEVGMEYSGNLGSGTNVMRVHYCSRRYGSVFRLKKVITLISGASSNFQDVRSFPDIIPALTDIKICVDYVSADNTGAWATFDILLVKEGQFKESYLKAIGQPGY